MDRPRRLFFSLAAFVISVIFPACGASPGGSGPGSASGYVPGRTVSANNAGRADLQAAFEHATMSNAGKPAREVEEYRSCP